MIIIRINENIDMSEAQIVLSMTEKIIRSNTNNVLSIPSLTYLNFILSKIVFSVVEDVWEFEMAIRIGGTDLVKLSSAYFKHHHEVDLAPYAYKISEGDKIDVVVKPKHCPKDINLELTYCYTPSEGALYYQNTIRLTELEDTNCTLMSDLTQQMRPTRIEIKVDKGCLIKGYSFVPKFKSVDMTGPDYNTSVDFETHHHSIVIDLTSDDFPDGILNQLKFYRLELKLTLDQKNDSNLDTPIHFLAYGFKSGI
jgi:hypothetical protein